MTFLKHKIIAVDFDGTIVDHMYPKIGNEVPGAFRWLKELQKYFKLILLTMRSDNELEEAVKYCKDNGVEFWSINDNPDQKSWTTSRKVYAHFYIDDAGIGCPLRENPRMNGRPYVNWDIVGEILLKKIS